MDISELRKIALQARGMREIGIALILTSMLLALFLLAPLTPETTPSSTIVVATSTIPDAFAQVFIEAKAAVVYDLVTGEILYGKNTDAQLPLASLTKLLTVYAALADLSPSTSITIPANVVHLRLEKPSVYYIP